MTTGDAADAMHKVLYDDADLAIAGRPENPPEHITFIKIGEIPLLLIAPALPCPAQVLAIADKPDWAQIPFILPEHESSRQRIELWFRRHNINHPLIYATVSSHDAIVSMVALGCGIALLPDVVLDNSPEPVRSRIIELKNITQVPSLELGVCVQKKRLSEPLVRAFWQ